MSNSVYYFYLGLFMKKSTLKHILDEIVLPQGQLIALIFTSLVICFLGYRATVGFHSVEQPPELFPITPNKITEWGGDPAIVKTGLHIINFPKFDMQNNDFIIDCIVWFEFDPSLVSLETIDKFSFDKSQIQLKYSPSTRLIDDKLFVEYELRIRFNSNLNFKYFPIDDHYVYITLVNTHVSPSDIIFQAEKGGFTSSKDMMMAGWKLYDTKVTTGYFSSHLDINDPRKVLREPRVNFALKIKRIGMRQALLIFFPLFLIFFIGLFAFGFDPKKQASNILSMASGGLTATIGYRFVMQGMSPRVGYFLFSDHMFTVFLCFVFMEFIVSVFLALEEDVKKYWFIIRSCMFILSHVTLISVWYYLLFMW